MIDFQRLDISQKPRLDPLLHSVGGRGCSYSFANLFLWGRMDAACIGGDVYLFSNYQGRSMYPNPIAADRKAAIDRIIADSKERGIPCRICDLTREDKQELEQLYPDQFRYHCDRDNFDYVYEIGDLAELKGRKFQQKRTRINHFIQDYPSYQVVELSRENLPEVEDLVNRWYEERLEADPHADLHGEKVAMHRALKYYEQLQMEGIGLWVDGRLVAMTMGSFLDPETVDVHFEKADTRYVGSYAMINREFARFLREKYPRLRFLNREDDLGSEGLRTAKLSYMPHHLVEKCWAHLRDEDYDE